MLKKITTSVQTNWYEILYFSRGMKFENVQTLTDAIHDIILDMKWCW